MKLRIYNKTSSVISYLFGTIVIQANGFVDIAPQYFNSIETDPNVRDDLIKGRIDISDTVNKFGNNDGIKQLDYMAGLRDREGNGVTSTLVDSSRALDVNVVNPISVEISPLAPVNFLSVIKYNELPLVPSGSQQVLLSYTVPTATRAILQKALVAGENIAKFQVNYNSNTIATKRTFFGSLNETFDFIETFNNGFLLEAGDLIEITVLQNRLEAADFESTLQIIEIR